MTRHAVAAAISLLVLLGGSPASAQLGNRQPDPHSYQNMLALVRTWGHAVATHEPGRGDDAATAIARWPSRNLYRVFAELQRLPAFMNSPRARKASPTGVIPRAEIEDALGLTPQEALGGNINRVLKRAALLHTDIEMLRLRGSYISTPSPFSGRYSITMQDGRDVGRADSAVHLEFASWLLDGVNPDPSGDDDVRLWYESVIAKLEDDRVRGDAEWLLARALGIFPLDARLLFYRGVVDEMMATPGVQMAARESESRIRQRLQDAAGLFQRALAADPGFDEARLHLGRVDGLLGLHEPAAEALRQVAAASVDRVLQYYAALFLGREEDALGHLDAARTAFDRAAGLYPKAQSALLAGSEIARREDDISGAQASLERLLALNPDEARNDPWWQYEVSHVRDADARLAAWRARFQSGAPR